jgi:hypothetical protein
MSKDIIIQLKCSEDYTFIIQKYHSNKGGGKLQSSGTQHCVVHM